MTVHQTYIVVCSFSELDRCHILKSEHITIGLGTDDHILIIGHVLVAATVLQHISECVLGLGSEGSCRGLEVLLREHCRDVGRHKVVLRHLSWIQPDTERVVTASYVHLADSGDT